MKRRQTRRLLELWRNIGQNETNIKALVKMKRYLEIGPRFLYLLYTEFGGDFGMGLYVNFEKPPYTSLIAYTHPEALVLEGYGEIGLEDIAQFKLKYYVISREVTTIGEIEYVNPWAIQGEYEWRRDAMMTQRWIITAQNSTA